MRTQEERTSRIRGRLPRAARGLLWAGLALAGIALLVAALPLCGRCGSGSILDAAIAGAGVLGYSVLLALEERGFSTRVTAGILAAGGVHAVLGGMMIARGSFCIVCAAAALVALSNVVTILAQVPGSSRWIPRALVPSFSLAWIVAYLGLSAAAAERRQAAASRALTVGSETTPEVTRGHPVLTVFEMEGCHYCLEFRSRYAPQLSLDFPDLEIVYRKAEDELWVRRTPTIALGETVLFEGLPTGYPALARAIAGGPHDRGTTRR